MHGNDQQLNNSFKKEKSKLESKVIFNSFKPIQDIKQKLNAKKYIRVYPDGSSIERIMLDVPGKIEREEVIFSHFLRFWTRNIKQKDVDYKLISRDKPWDFSVSSSDGDSFNLEIVSIAENQWLFTKLKREEEYKKLLGEEKIKFRQLIKISRTLNLSDSLIDYVSKLGQEGTNKDDIVQNPLYGQSVPIFVSDTKVEHKSFLDLIIEAIESKNKKKHADKEKTILLIDNRTIKFQVKDYFKAVQEYVDKEIQFPFKEIFLYTGYYSDKTGNIAEFSFSEIQFSKETKIKFENTIELGGMKLDQNSGIYHY